MQVAKKNCLEPLKIKAITTPLQFWAQGWHCPTSSGLPLAPELCGLGVADHIQFRQVRVGLIRVACPASAGRGDADRARPGKLESILAPGWLLDDQLCPEGQPPLLSHLHPFLRKAELASGTHAWGLPLLLIHTQTLGKATTFPGPLCVCPLLCHFSQATYWKYHQALSPVTSRLSGGGTEATQETLGRRSGRM